jgi:DNA repair protein RAD7
VPNRSRRARREEQATPGDMSIDPPTPSDDASSMEGVEQTVTVAAQSSSSSLTTTATEEMTFTASSSKKKRKDDSDDDDDVDFAPSSSRKAVKGRARILFCVVCKSRFARDINDDNEETLCSDCKAGNSPSKPVKPKKKRLNVSKKEQLLAHDRVPSLQDICISVGDSMHICIQKLTVA